MVASKLEVSLETLWTLRIFRLRVRAKWWSNWSRIFLLRSHGAYDKLEKCPLETTNTHNHPMSRQHGRLWSPTSLDICAFVIDFLFSPRCRAWLQLGNWAQSRIVHATEVLWVDLESGKVGLALPFRLLSRLSSLPNLSGAGLERMRAELYTLLVGVRPRWFHEFPRRIEVCYVADNLQVHIRRCDLGRKVLSAMAHTVHPERAARPSRLPTERGSLEISRASRSPPHSPQRGP